VPWCSTPWVAYAGSWYLAAILLLVAGACIPFRVVSMNTSWLERLPEVGRQRAGWYRGTLMLGIGLLGPLLGTAASARLGMHGSYWITSGLFALMGVYGFIILSRTRADQSQTGILPAARDMLGQLRNPVIRQVCVFDGLGSLVRGFFGTFIIVIAVRQFHWDEQTGIRLLVVEGATFCRRPADARHAGRSTGRGPDLPSQPHHRGVGLAVAGLERRSGGTGGGSRTASGRTGLPPPCQCVASGAVLVSTWAMSRACSRWSGWGRVRRRHPRRAA
jgi:hypothetical protein